MSKNVYISVQLFEIVIFNTPNHSLFQKNAEFKLQTWQFGCHLFFYKMSLEITGRNALFVHELRGCGYFRALMFIIITVYPLIKLDEYGANIGSLWANYIPSDSESFNIFIY